MNATQTTAPVRIAANYAVSKHLGNWTTARQFQVRAHRGHAVLDLRSPHIDAGESRRSSAFAMFDGAAIVTLPETGPRVFPVPPIGTPAIVTSM